MITRAFIDSLLQTKAKLVAHDLLEEYTKAIQRHYDKIREPKSIDEARGIALDNIGYYAEYCDKATRERVERLYGAYGCWARPG